MKYMNKGFPGMLSWKKSEQHIDLKFKQTSLDRLALGITLQAESKNLRISSCEWIKTKAKISNGKFGNPDLIKSFRESVTITDVD